MWEACPSGLCLKGKRPKSTNTLKCLLVCRHCSSGRGWGNPCRLRKAAVPADHLSWHYHVSEVTFDLTIMFVPLPWLASVKLFIQLLWPSSDHSVVSILIQWLWTKKSQCLSLSSATEMLWDLGQVTYPPWTTAFLSIKQRFKTYIPPIGTKQHNACKAHECWAWHTLSTQ